MRGLVFYDDARARTFEPFALSRPLSEMRVGAPLLRERWEHASMSSHKSAFVSSSHLANFSEADRCLLAPEVLQSGTVLINSRAAIALDVDDIFDELPTANVINALTIAGELAALHLNVDVPRAWLSDGSLSLRALAEQLQIVVCAVEVDGVWLNEVWDITRHLTPLLNADIPALVKRHNLTEYVPVLFDTIAISSRDRVWYEPGAVIEPHTFFDTSAGPVLIRKGATVQAFTRVVGPCYIGPDSIVGGDRVAACSIGDNCRVHGEISNSVLVGHSNKGHDGFVGHSILGRWVNLGAGTTTSNLKNTYGTVALWTRDGLRDTGLQFLGTLFGDHVKTGVGLMLTTGCVLGMGANVFERMPPKVVEPFAWGSAAPYDTYELSRFVETAERMMSRRHVELTDAMRASLIEIHAARWRAT